MSIALDREALDDVAQTDPDVGTVDGFVERMTDSELFEKIVGNCTLEATLTSTGDMEILLGAVSPRDAESSQLCNKLAEVYSIACDSVLRRVVYSIMYKAGLLDQGCSDGQDTIRNCGNGCIMSFSHPISRTLLMR